MAITLKPEDHLAIFVQGTSVVVKFPVSVEVIGLTGNQAIELGNILLKCGRQVNFNQRGGNGEGGDGHGLKTP